MAEYGSELDPRISQENKQLVLNLLKNIEVDEEEETQEDA
jgi:hypothetical protein